MHPDDVAAIFHGDLLSELKVPSGAKMTPEGYSLPSK